MDQLANSLRPLCYEHHAEMRLVPTVSGNGTKPTREPKYACQESDCQVYFTSAEGYFVVPHETGQVEEEMLPRVRCPHDGALMYLGEVRPRERSFRLWRCPLCAAASTSEQTRGSNVTTAKSERE